MPLSRPVIGAKFLNVKDGKARSICITPSMRAAVAQWIVENRVDRVEAKTSMWAAILEKSTSTDQELVFSRPQPATKK